MSTETTPITPPDPGDQPIERAMVRRPEHVPDAAPDGNANDAGGAGATVVNLRKHGGIAPPVPKPAPVLPAWLRPPATQPGAPDHGTAEHGPADHHGTSAAATSGSSGGQVVPRGVVVDGEIVDGTGTGDAGRPGSAVALRAAGRVARRQTVHVITTMGTVAKHERTKAAAKFVARHALLYVAVGGWVVVTRLWEAKTNSRYERLMRAAETAGNMELLQDWEQRAEQARDRRHRRRMDWIAAPFALAKAVAAGAVTVLALLLALGIVLAITNKDIGQVLGPINALFAVVTFLAWLLAISWGPLVAALPWAVLGGLWHLGRNHGTIPGWAAPTRDIEQESVIITPGGVATALAHLGIAPLNKAIKDGWRVEFSTPPVRVNNRGYQTVFSLPMGVTPEMVADKREILARNLVRAPLEVWPAAAAQAGWLDLWVADQGATEKRAPEYPLLHDGVADVFVGVPLGVSQRGDVIGPPLVGANFGLGGLMGQGKSNAARVVVAGAALDPLAELWVFVFAGNGDFDAYQPRLARYARGTDDSVAAAGLQALRDLYVETGRREARLAEIGAKKLTRTVAEQHPDLRPTVAVFSECHELFGHEEYGKEAADLAVQTLRRARKTGLILGFDTQSSRADAIPPKVVELLKLNACFAVKTWRSNDGFLGDGSFQAGIRATELRPGKDVGTSVLTGATAERFEIVKWFYIEVDDDTGFDAAADIIARSLTTVHRSVKTGATPAPVAEPAAPRDLLEDLDEVLGTERIPAADVPALLRDLAPDWGPYRTLNGTQLRALLAAEGIKVPSTGHKYPVDPVTVRARLARRATADLDADQ